MNAAEKLVLNSGLRRAVQRRYEAPLPRRLGADAADGQVLEIGCGAGGGTQILTEVMRARQVDAIDLTSRSRARPEPAAGPRRAGPPRRRRRG